MASNPSQTPNDPVDAQGPSTEPRGRELAGGEAGRPASGPAAFAPGSDRGELGEEHDVWRGRMSWKHLTGHWILWGAAAVLLCWLWWHFRTPESTPWFGRIVALLVLGAAAGLYVKSAITVHWKRYRLTTQRLFIETGILGRTTDQTELFRVDDVRIHQGPFDRLFGIGDVELVAPSDSTQASVRVVGIMNPSEVAEHIRRHSRELRMRRSIFLEQT